MLDFPEVPRQTILTGTTAALVGPRFPGLGWRQVNPLKPATTFAPRFTPTGRSGMPGRVGRGISAPIVDSRVRCPSLFTAAV